MKKSNVLPSRGCRNSDIYSVRPGWIDFSHAVTGTMLISSVPVIFSLCTDRVLYQKVAFDL